MSTYRYWKHFERKVAKILGGDRVTKKGVACEDDCHHTLSIECKSTEGELPMWLKEAMTQAKANCPPGKLPVVALGEKGGTPLLVFDIYDWKEWYG